MSIIAKITLHIAGIIVALLLVGTTMGAEPLATATRPVPDAAAEILSIPGLRPGIAACVGRGNGELAIGLARGGVQAVHGLAADAAAMEAARRNALAAGFAGQVAIGIQAGTRLPYADDLLNLLVIDNYPALRKSGVTFSEMWRVVGPYNTLVLGGVDDAEALRGELLKAGCAADALHKCGRWHWVVKPLPAVMDEWPERYHDAGHSRVSHDQLVGPATGLRWIEGSIWASSPSGSLGQEILAADGRTFYVEKSYQDPLLADLVARDAFNGQLLWSRKIALSKATDTEWAAASAERVFARLTSDGPVVALNAANGQTLWSSQLHGAFCCSDGLLIVRSDQNHWIALDQSTGVEARRFEVSNSYHDAQAVAGEGLLVALEAGPAEIADAQHVDDPPWRADLFKQNRLARGSLVCFSLKTGDRVWKQPNVGDGWPYWLCKGLVMTRNNSGKMNVFAASDGAYHWSQAMGTKMFGWTAAFYMGDTIWGYIPQHSWYQAYDPATGTVRKTDGGRAKEFGRCAEDIATDRWILGQELQITDFAEGRTYDQFFTRAACATGYTPAYGLFYNHTHTCSCTDYIRGIEGISCVPAPKVDIVADPLVEHGPAYGQALSASNSTAEDWPTYRHDAFRSSGCETAVSAAATAQWSTTLAAPLSSPVVVGGVAYVACIDQHRLVAMDVRNGKILWDYLAGGRIDTPPTIYRGLALFGCRDGLLYAVRATDGQLAWRVRLAPEDRYISVRGRLESAWPLFGAVLVDHDMIWATAGRHGDADGGVWAATLDPATGRVLWRQNFHGYPPYRDQSTTRLIEARGKIPDAPTDAAMAAADPKFVAAMGHTFSNDVLISDGKTIFLGGLGIDAATHKAGPPVGQAIFTNGVTMPVDTMLWGVYWDRLSWTFAGKADSPAWMSIRAKDVPLGNLISIARNTAYCAKFPNIISAKPLESGPGWSTSLDGKGFMMKAMIAAGDRLVVGNRIEGPDKSSLGEIRVLSASNGKELGRTMLPVPPRFDGLAVGSGVLVVSLEDGKVVCFPAQPANAAPPVLAIKPPPATRPAMGAIAAVLPMDDARTKLLRGTKLPIETGTDVLAAMADGKFAVVIADADLTMLKNLAAPPDALKAFTARGGWLVLWGLEPAGLASFNQIVGVEHLLRPVELEKVSLANGTDLLPGCTNEDVAIEGTEGDGSGQHYPALDAWYGAVDYDDIAPFCTLPGPEFWGRPGGKPMTDRWPRNMVNGFTNENWRLQFVFDLDKGGHTSIPMRLPRRETVTGFGFYPGPYGQVRRVRLVSDVPGVAPAEVTLAAVAGRQDFKIPPMAADNITVELVDWEPSVKVPVIGIANLWLPVQRSDDFRQRVHPLLNPGLLVSYPRGRGGIVLSQVRPRPIDVVKETRREVVELLAREEAKKRALMSCLLQSLAVTDK